MNPLKGVAIVEAQYSIAEAKNRLPSIIHAVEKGAPVKLTRHGRPVAVMLSISQYERLNREKEGYWSALTSFRKLLEKPKIPDFRRRFRGTQGRFAWPGCRVAVKKYLLDTNVLSEAVKTTPDGHVMTMLQRHQDEIVTAAPVWHELRYGCLRLPVSRKREMIEAYLEDVVWRNLDILPYDEQAAGWHAEERARLTTEVKRRLLSMVRLLLSPR